MLAASLVLLTVLIALGFTAMRRLGSARSPQTSGHPSRHATARVEVPEEVQAFLQQAESAHVQTIGISPLDVERCGTYSAQIRSFDPAFEALGLIALDDSNNSNPYRYITAGPATGMVLLVRHDDAPEIRYASLERFMDALARAKQDQRRFEFEDFEPVQPLADQEGLQAFLLSLADRDDELAEGLLGVLVPLLLPEASRIYERLSTHPSLWVRESVAIAMSKHPLRVHEFAAIRLSQDHYPQVARPAKSVLAAIAAS